MPEKTEQKFTIGFYFKDEASPRFVKATNEHIAAVKKLGIAVKKEGKAVVLDMDKMAASSEKTGRSMRFLGGEITGVMKSLGSMRNMLLVYMFALRPLMSLIKDSIEAFSRQEDAIKRISYAMDLQGTYTIEMRNRLLKLADGFQDVTRYGNEAVLEVMGTFLTMGNVFPTQLEQVTQAVLDLSAATGKDLSTSAAILSKAAEGIIPSFKELRIEISKTIPPGKVLDEVLKKINERMGGRAQQDVKSYAGAVAQLENNMGDLQKNIGRLIIEGLKLIEVTRFWSDLFKKIVEAITTGITPLRILEFRLHNVNVKIKETNAELSKLYENKDTEIKGFWNIRFRKGEIEKTQKDLQKLLVEADAITKTILREKELIFNEQKALDQKMAETKLAEEKRKVLEEFDERYLEYQRRQASFRLTELEKDFNKYREAYANNAAALKEIDDLYAYEKSNLQKEMLNETKKTLDLSVMFTQAAAKNMQIALSSGFVKIIKGEFESLKDVVIDFGNMMIEAIAQMAAIAVLKRAGFSALLGHTGGYINPGINTSFGYGKKFHSGGEVPATLLEGEGVLNRTGMRNLGVDNLNKLNRGEQAGSGTVINNYYIQTIDERSFRDRLQQHGDIYTGAAELGIRDNTSLRKTSQKWG